MGWLIGIGIAIAACALIYAGMTRDAGYPLWNGRELNRSLEVAMSGLRQGLTLKDVGLFKQYGGTSVGDYLTLHGYRISEPSQAKVFKLLLERELLEADERVINKMVEQARITDSTTDSSKQRG